MKTFQAHILATGDELSTGSLVDTNSAHIAQVLEGMGVSVRRHVTVGDDMEDLAAVLKETGEAADIAVVTGGLGPTLDDLSSEAAARAAGVKLVLDPEAMAWIEALFAAIGRTMGESNKKQAYFPEGAERLDNPIGTAPGFSLTIGRSRFFFLPGVPREMRLMLEQQVAPRIREMRGTGAEVSSTRTICAYGLPEAAVGERVADVAQGLPGLKVGLRASFPQIQVKLYGRGQDRRAVDALLEKAVARVLERLEEHAYSAQGESLPQAVGRLLVRERATLAVAESCTGGQIAHWLTSVAGSSDYFLLSAVTYANAAKEAVLGVSPRTLEAFGAVHESTAAEMAQGARRIAKATYGLATSGIAGPAGGTEDKPVGTVCIALATPQQTFTHRFHSPFGERGRNIQVFSMNALDVLRRHILGLAPPPWRLQKP